MTQQRPPIGEGLTRRRFLQGSALAGFGAFLAACGGTGGLGSAVPSSSPAGSEGPAASQTPKVATGPLHFANWPAYIDLVGTAGEEGAYAPGSSPTLEEFKKTFGVEVDYQEKIGDNAEFLQTIEPAMVAGLPTGWDLIAMNDWVVAKLIAAGWLEEIDKANVPNAVANLRDAMRGVDFDPDNKFHYPWQSGMTGIGVNTAALKENKIAEPTKIADLWSIDPKRVTFLVDARDTFPMTMLTLGIDPVAATVTKEDFDKAAAAIQPLVDKGLEFVDNAYLTNFNNKHTWAAFVWSGDLASSGTADDKFIFPEEGVMLWTDNMMIPKGAANKYTAELMINFVYDPRIAAQIANYVYYVSPVEGAAEEILKLDPDAGENPLLFPPPDVIAKAHSFDALSPEIEAYMADLFGKLRGL